MIEQLKRMRWLYALYNFFHKKQLWHNELQYKKLGLRKKYWASVSSKDFVGMPGSLPLNFKVELGALKGTALFDTVPQPCKNSLLAFEENGFAVIKGYLNSAQVDAVNDDIAQLLTQKKVAFTNRNKIMFAVHASPLLQNIGNDDRLKELLGVLIGGEAVLFQSINFITGSEQHTHSDSIHMTTYPLGGLLGVWIALDDVTEENGPLHYYPQSHKLPYYLNADYKNEGTALLLGDKSYTEYESMIAEKIAAQNLHKVKFLAKKGDLLIWHANLFHGGDPHLDKSKTRRSMVLHYFKQGAVCYHEITQRPALIKTM